MSQTTVESGNRLSEVLSRINALSRQSQAQPSHEASHEDSVPRLTESYDGHLPLQFIKAGSVSLPVLEDLVSDSVSEDWSPELSTVEPAISQSEDSASPIKLTAEQQEQMLREMEPVIRDAVKRAILRELVVIEKALKTTLERDVMDELRKRLETGQF
jgi:hypothetical protein